MRFRAAALSGGAVLTVLSAPALAQDAQADQPAVQASSQPDDGSTPNHGDMKGMNTSGMTCPT